VQGGWSNAFSLENGDLGFGREKIRVLFTRRGGGGNFTMCFGSRSFPGEWRSVLEGGESGFVHVKEISSFTRRGREGVLGFQINKKLHEFQTLSM
jgi:hypothetical protein